MFGSNVSFKFGFGVVAGAGCLLTLAGFISKLVLHIFDIVEKKREKAHPAEFYI